MQMRGSVAGALWGVVLGGVGLGVASIVAEPPVIADVANLPVAPSTQTEVAPSPTPEAQAPDVQVAAPAETPETATPAAPPAIAETAGSAPDAPAEIAEDEPVAPATQQSAAEPQVATAPNAPDAATETDSLPGSETPQDIAAPEADDEPRDLAVASDDRPEVTETVPEALAAPQTEAIAAEVTTEPDSIPVMAEAMPLPEPVVEPTAEIEVKPPPVPPADVAEEIEETPQAEIAAIPLDDAASDAPAGAAPFTPPVEPIPEFDEEPEPARVPAPPPVVAPEPQLAAPLPPLTAEEPTVIAPAPEPAQTAEASQLPQVITTLPGGNSGVRVIRPDTAPAEQAGTPAQEVTAEAPVEDAPALNRYAAAFDNPQGWPMIAVVLLDDGSTDNAPALAAALPFPVTVVLDPLQNDVSGRMRAYRAQGIEVGLQVALPFGARAQDVEVAFEAAFDMVPEAVIVYSGGDDLVQSNFAVTEQAVEVLAAEGLGLIAAERGLSSVLRTAAQADVPAMAVQRSIAEEDLQIMGRLLDQAAFRARQGTGVVLAGRMTPALLTGLEEWATKADINQIAMAPASALLSQQ